MVRRIVFIIPPNVELLDLAGPIQVFREAKQNGLEIDIEYYSWLPRIQSAPGIVIDGLRHYRDVHLSENDYLFLPGLHIESLDRSRDEEENLFRWLNTCSANKVTLCAVCNAAFILGQAGLLDNKECTTHWRSIDLLKQLYPKAKVLDDVLYVKSQNVYTTAGISAGIDMALDVLESLKGALFAYEVARALVIYQRRSSNHNQRSIYLDYRNHINPKIHEVQDYLSRNLSSPNRIDNLAQLVSMSPRNLTRLFKEQTGSTIIEYLTLLRREYANTMLKNPEYTLEYIAAECGFKSARQLLRILK
jgi:transcriptional regulator GlxA family with amidase domain